MRGAGNLKPGMVFARTNCEANEMSGQNTVALCYAVPAAVMRTLKTLANSGCAIEFSLVAKEDQEAGENANPLDDALHRLWSSLSTRARFTVAEVGTVLIAGPMSGLMVKVFNNVSMFDGLNPLEACLHSIGVSTDTIPLCMANVQAGGILLLLHGPAKDVANASDILRGCSPDQ